jgi:hypothetical protein
MNVLDDSGRSSSSLDRPSAERRIWPLTISSDDSGRFTKYLTSYNKGDTPLNEKLRLRL